MGPAKAGAITSVLRWLKAAALQSDGQLYQTVLVRLHWINAEPIVLIPAPAKFLSALANKE